jgi:cytochrome c oxidase subunit III
VRAPVLDVRHLPSTAFGPRVTVWWGVLGLLAIEGTMFAMLVGSYFYLRQDSPAWPPLGTPPPAIGVTTANVALLVLSVIPMALVDRAARRRQRVAIAGWLLVLTLAGLASCALRWFEFFSLGCRWDDHAYGSIVWVILGMHMVHLVTSTAENFILDVLMFRGPVEMKHFVDVHVNALYWYFVVGSWVVLYAIVVWAPRLM